MVCCHEILKGDLHVCPGYPEPKPFRDERDEDNMKTSEEEKQLNKLLQEVLTLEGQPYDASPHTFNPLESDEDRKTRLGKLNLDKWLQRLLLNSGSDAEKNVGKLGNLHDKQSSNKDGCTNLSTKYPTVRISRGMRISRERC